MRLVFQNNLDVFSLNGFSVLLVLKLHLAEFCGRLETAVHAHLKYIHILQTFFLKKFDVIICYNF